MKTQLAPETATERQPSLKPLVSWKVGGEQGEGIDSAGEILATACNRLGYYIFGYRHFSSRIKGGHSNYKIRIGTSPVRSTSKDTHILVAVDQETIDKNHHELVPGGVIVADQDFGPKLPDGCAATLLSVPMVAIAKEVGNPIMKNVVAVGMSAYLLGLPIGAVEALVREQFAKKGAKVQDANAAALHQGYQYIAEQHGELTQWRLAPGDGKARLLMIGNEAAGLGALVAGCRVMAAYPITPASETMEYLIREMPKVGGVVVQAEDEIAAITTAIGAGFAGARAMTSTSGPGISLMQEAIGLAHMAEIPVVIIDTQRGGPSTGMPTKQEQSDVMALLYGSHGDTQRICLAPASVEDCFYDVQRAFNLAERYQQPVFVAMDLLMALGKQTVEELDPNRVSRDRGERMADEELLALGPNVYRRYAVTESGISPRALPGQPNGQYLATGVEHSEFGKVNEDPQNRVNQMDKRARKIERIDLDQVIAEAPGGIVYEGPVEGELDLLLVAFGSNYGPVAESRARLEDEGQRVGHAHVRVLAPFPARRLGELLGRARRTLVVENNKNAQLLKVMRIEVPEAGLARITSALKYNGNPFLPIEVYEKSKEVLSDGHAG